MDPYLKPEKSEKKKPQRIRPRSNKRARQEREYSKKNKQYLIDHPICEVFGCCVKSTEIHHKKGRVGDLLTDEQYFMAVCGDHHRKIELHPSWAKEMGYSLNRLSK